MSHACCALAVRDTLLYVAICYVTYSLDTDVCSLMLFTETLLHQVYRSTPGSLSACVRLCSTETIDLHHSQ